MTKEEEEADFYFDKFWDVDQVVYIFYNENTGYTKIGITDNVDRRLRQIQTASGCMVDFVEYTYIGKLQDLSARDVERFLHKKYKQFRKIGEWFSLTWEQINICQDEMLDLCEFGSKSKYYK